MDVLRRGRGRPKLQKTVKLGRPRNIVHCKESFTENIDNTEELKKYQLKVVKGKVEWKRFLRDLCTTCDLV